MNGRVLPESWSGGTWEKTLCLLHSASEPRANAPGRGSTWESPPQTPSLTHDRNSFCFQQALGSCCYSSEDAGGAWAFEVTMSLTFKERIQTSGREETELRPSILSNRFFLFLTLLTLPVSTGSNFLCGLPEN